MTDPDRVVFRCSPDPDEPPDLRPRIAAAIFISRLLDRAAVLVAVGLLAFTLTIGIIL